MEPPGGEEGRRAGEGRDLLTGAATAAGNLRLALADRLWQLSSELNDRRRDHPISPSTLTKVAAKPRTSCQHALFMLRWLDRTPESFLAGMAGGDDPRFALRPAGAGRNGLSVAAGTLRPWPISR